MSIKARIERLERQRPLEQRANLFRSMSTPDLERTMQRLYESEGGRGRFTRRWARDRIGAP